MKLYLVNAKVENDIGEFDDVSQFVGSQAEAATVRQRIVTEGTPRKNITTTPVDVPTDKEGLLRFLNLMATSPTVAVATEKLLAD
jgi:hypothetical protein